MRSRQWWHRRTLSIAEARGGKMIPKQRFLGTAREYNVLLMLLLFACSGCQSLSLYGSALGSGWASSRWNTISSRDEKLYTGNVNQISLSKASSIVESSTFVTSSSLLRWEEELALSGGTNTWGTTSTATRSILVMGKGDGKKKRPKKKPATVASSDPSPKQPAPQRVSSDINVPVRMQIMYGQMRKERNKQAGTSFRQKKVVRTKYRRTWDEEEIELKREERKRKGTDPDWSVILNRTASSPLVIVDGYNVIHKWPRLKKHMKRGDPARARRLLIDDLEELRSIKGWRIEVVFDGTGRSTVGPLGDGPRGQTKVTAADRATKTDVSTHGVRVVFSGVGVEADSYIESRCAEAKNVTEGKLTGSFIVATDDVMIRMAGLSAGALCMGADRLVDELKAVKKTMGYRVEVAVAKANGHAIRPEKLRGTHFHTTFGKRQFVIEDKRNRTKARKAAKMAEKEREGVIKPKLPEEDDNSIPWWAVVPNHTRPFPPKDI